MMKKKGWIASTARALLWAILILAVLALIGYVVLFSLWANPPHVSHQAALADLDGDGDLDAVLANGVNEGRSESTTWINQGGAQAGRIGQFVPGPQLGSAEYHSLAVGDLDSDGDVDILLGNTWYGMDLFINKGGTQDGKAGQFLSSNPLMGGGFWGGPHPIGLGDLDGDGDLDIVTGNCCGGLMMNDNEDPTPLPAFNLLWINQAVQETRKNLTTPPFLQLAAPIDGLEGTQALALGDLDGDGDLDVFLAKTRETYGPKKDEYQLRAAYRVWWNDGAGSFTAGTLDLACPNVTDLALGDLDGDGDLDVLAATQQGGEVLLNQGGAQAGLPAEFSAAPERLGSLSTTSVFLGDLDGDGRLDALLGSAGRAQVWLNQGQGKFILNPASMRFSRRDAVAIGDVNGDGTLDVFSARLADHYKVWINLGSAQFSAAR